MMTMQNNLRFLLRIPVGLFVLSACAMPQQKYLTANDGSSATPAHHQPPSQTRSVPVSAGNNTPLTMAVSAHEIESAAIEVPRMFDIRDLRDCSDENTAPWNCLPKKTIRIWVDRNQSQVSGGGDKYNSRSNLRSIDNLKLSSWLGNFVARTGRFRIIARDRNAINEELQLQGEQGGAAGIRKSHRRRKVLIPDIVLRVDVTKSASYMYRGTYGDVSYGIRVSSAFVDPYSSVILSDPAIPDIHESYPPQKYIAVNGKYYTGFDYTSQHNVEKVFQEIAGKAFRVIVNRLINSVPSTAKVLAVRNDRLTLDRGIEAGILPSETMIIFQDLNGVLEPLAVARIQPGRGRSSGVITRWKNSLSAQKIRNISIGQTIKTNRRRIFAVSVGTPKGYEF